MTAPDGVHATGQVTGQVTDVEGRTVEVEIPYNVVDSHGTVWLPGCFTRSLQRRLPPVVMNHNASVVVGRVVGYRDSPTAMHMTIRLADPAAVPDARAAQSLLREHIIDEVSFRFVHGVAVLMRDRFGSAPCLRSATVQEVSFVTIGSVPGARVLAMRSAAPDEELTPEELGEIERIAAVGYSAAELSALHGRQALDMEVRAAMLKLGRLGSSTSSLSDAGIRARAATMPPRPPDPKEQAAREKQQRELDWLDRLPPERRPPVYVDAPSYVPPAADPAAPPGEDLAILAREAQERGENVADVLRAADQSWRSSYGAMYAKTAPARNEPDWRGERPYPPDDLLQVAALAAAERNEDPQRAVADTIRNWRVARGFESE